VQAHDVVLRHLRVRTGRRARAADGWDNRDVINFGRAEALGETTTS
jgi:hypothetical protein